MEGYKIRKKRGADNLFYCKRGADDLTIAVVADKHRIIQVVSNLLNNAVKFTKQGVITISTAKKKKDNNNSIEEDEVIVSIRDTGIGYIRRYYLNCSQNLLVHHQKGPV